MTVFVVVVAGISSAKHPILDLNHTSSGSVIREFRMFHVEHPVGKESNVSRETMRAD